MHAPAEVIADFVHDRGGASSSEINLLEHAGSVRLEPACSGRPRRALVASNKAPSFVANTSEEAALRATRAPTPTGLPPGASSGPLIYTIGF